MSGDVVIESPDLEKLTSLLRQGGDGDRAIFVIIVDGDETTISLTPHRITKGDSTHYMFDGYDEQGVCHRIWRHGTATEHEILSE